MILGLFLLIIPCYYIFGFPKDNNYNKVNFRIKKFHYFYYPFDGKYRHARLDFFKVKEVPNDNLEIENMIENALSMALTIRRCSGRGGRGIIVPTIFSLEIFCCAPPPPFAINSFL